MDKIYHILIKNNNSFGVLYVPAENRGDAEEYARTKGEIVSVFEVEDGYSLEDIAYDQRLLDYYPEVIKAVREYKALVEPQGVELENIHGELTKLLDNVYISTADANTLSKWEQLLGITPLPQGDDPLETWLSDRRETILARLFKPEKLNSKSISDIVKIFTGGEAISHFADGTVYVTITPPKNNKQYKFANVEQELRKRIPAHLMFQVVRNYYTWAQTKTDHSTWGDVNSTLSNWEEVLLNNTVDVTNMR